MKIFAKGFLMVLAGLFALGLAQADDRDIGDQLNDARMEGQLWSAFALNEHLRAFDLSVDVRGSRATLSGEVEESVQKELAEAVALDMDGIDDVDNRIEVADDPDRTLADRDRAGERTFGDRVSDATTTATVKSKLLWNRDTSGLNIEVSTENGEVTLQGDADSDASRALAERLASNTRGVHSVSNQLNVRADGDRDTDRDSDRDAGDVVSDAWITTKVRSTLLYSRDVPGSGISIETRDGVVTLEGDVETASEKERAVELASGIRGVREVNDSGLTVVRGS